MKKILLTLLTILIFNTLNLYSQTFTIYTNVDNKKIWDIKAGAVDYNNNLNFCGWGVIRYNPLNQQFTYTTNSKYLFDLYCIAPENEDTIWLGNGYATNLGFIKFNGQNIVEYYNGANSGMLGGYGNDASIYDLAIDRNHKLWYSANHWFTTLQPNTWDMIDRWTGWNQIDNTWPGRFAIDSNNNIWYVRDADSNVWFYSNYQLKKLYVLAETGIPLGVQVITAAIDNKNNKWIGYFINYGNQIIAKADKNNNWSQILTNECHIKSVNSIMVDNDDRIWVLSRGEGVSVYNGTNWTVYRQSDGLYDNDPFVMLQDCNGVYWIGHGVALTKLEIPGRVGLKINNYTFSKAYNNGITEILEINGTGFKQGLKVVLKKKGNANIYAQSVTMVSSTKITCRFDLTGANTGLWDLMVLNPWVWPQVNYRYIVHNAIEIKTPPSASSSPPVTQSNAPAVSQGNFEESFLYPNVLRDVKIIELKKIPGDIMASVYDKLGNLLKETDLGLNNNKIDISKLSLTTGIYYVIVLEKVSGKKRMLKFLFIK